MQQVLTREESLNQLARYLAGQGVASSSQAANRKSVTDFAREDFYIAGDDYAPAQTIKLLPHQIAILNFMFNPPEEYVPDIGYFQTLVYSCPKKSGKSAMSSLVTRWVAETWNKYGQIFCLANDYEQARGRVYQQVIESIMLDPNYNRGKREIPGRWRIIDREALHIPSGTKIKAVAADYKGEAGSNPTLTLWDELWGFSSEASHRLWEEMTPVPTRSKSVRFISTYAGFQDESDLLFDLYQQGTDPEQGAVRVDIPGWPFEDPSPIYINKQASLCMYWDTGSIARRMPWQTPEYYIVQANALRPQAFDRLHNNFWTTSTESFLPLEWWNSCYDEDIARQPINQHTSCVIGVDASVTNDCTVLVLMSKHPNQERGVTVRAGKIWKPTNANPMNYSEPEGLKETIIEWCKKFNVVEITYDAFQLHSLMTDLRIDGIAWCRPFAQGGDRNRADKQLYDLIRDRRISHYGDPDMFEHLKNAGAKSSKEEDTRFRIVKKTTKGKIDYVVAMSMAAYECLRLDM